MKTQNGQKGTKGSYSKRIAKGYDSKRTASRRRKDSKGMAKGLQKGAKKKGKRMAKRMRKGVSILTLSFSNIFAIL